jgi:hypothetical protein
MVLNNSTGSAGNQKYTKHSNKVQVWIPQVKPKVKPKPKKEHVSSESKVIHSSDFAHICSTLPRSGCYSNCAVHTQNGTETDNKSFKSQSCDQIACKNNMAATNRNRPTNEMLENEKVKCTQSCSSQCSGAESSTHTSRQKGTECNHGNNIKGRSQTPPRVLSPNAQQMACNVIADL